ncbi:MAG TPA: hypothetical protein VEF89_33535 [Solirubrobacteraceae bacterium]|nr:hypothetical protein [Solirubrobacteraceae bacterium]
MARRGAPDEWDPPAIVEITVTQGPRARTVPARRLVAVIGVLAVILAGVGVGVAVVHGAGGSAGAAHASGNASDPGPVAAASREPLRCLNAAVSAAWPAEIDRGGPCWHYGVNLTTILRYVHGVWRLALAARSSSCPNVPLPPPVRAQLVVCRR